MTIYGHYIKYGPKYSDHIRSVIPLLVYFRPPAGYFTAALSSLCTYESTLKPSGRCCPASNSTSVSRILVSTCSDGSSVRTFFLPRIFPARNARPQNLCVPYASAFTYARWPPRSFETLGDSARVCDG